MSKYSTPAEDGRKHYVVTVVRWGRVSDQVVLAEDAPDARYEALGRPGPGEYVSKVRRASAEEVEST